MITASNLIGMYIVDKSNGNKLCNVKEIIYSKDFFKVVGFCVDSNSLRNDTKIVKLKDIKEFGENFLMIEEERVLKSPCYYPKIDKMMSSKYYISGYEILCEDGISMGFIKDVVFEEKKGRILGFKVTDGLVQDFLGGRSFMPYVEGMKFNENFLLIDRNIKENFEKNKEEYKKLLSI